MQLREKTLRKQSGRSSLPPRSQTPQDPESGNVKWRGVFRQSLSFLVIEEGFRYATENGARHTHLPFFAGYINSATNLHGWADGDPFLVNYVGHPMQGSVSGLIWLQNDHGFRYTEFGKNREYWKGRLRAAAFAFVYSELSEIGPLSEATVGATQASYPQQGFVDHIVTPTIGLAWILAEDAVDKYVVKTIERHVSNPYVRLLVRGGLNPSRSFANALGGKVPWNRYTRPGVFAKADPLLTSASVNQVYRPVREYPKVAPFEFTTLVALQRDFGSSGVCPGGGGEAAIRVHPQLQIALQVAGCKLMGLDKDWSGDSLTFLVGPRWTPYPAARWSPIAEILAGGRKITTEEMFPAKRAALEEALQQTGQKLSDPDHSLYTRTNESTGFSVKAGVGVDMKLNSALAFRVANLDYTFSWADEMGGHHAQGLQLTSGLVLRMGTW